LIYVLIDNTGLRPKNFFNQSSCFLHIFRTITGKIVKKFHHVPFSQKFRFSILEPSGSLQGAKNHLNGVKP